MKAVIMLIILGITLAGYMIILHGNEEESAVVLVQGLEVPWAIDFLPNDTMIFTERGGRVSLFDENVRVIAELNALHQGEGGLHGVAVDPNFSKNKFIYLYYTHEEGNRIARFTLEETLSEERVIIDNIPRARFHNGGRIKFGPDGFLYITTGDAGQPALAQNTTSLAGKVLRIHKNGSIPSENPFDNAVYSYGHRNPQGLAFHPETQALYASDHGPSQKDRINKIDAGANYGWPVTCDDLEEHHTPAVSCYTRFTLAPSGIAFYEGSLYVAGLRGAQVRQLTFSEQTVLEERESISGLGRIREVIHHKGEVYIATNNRDGRGFPRTKDDRILQVTTLI